jgi:hypothetical protein
MKQSAILLLPVLMTLSVSAGVCLAQNFSELTLSDIKIGDTADSARQKLLAKNPDYEFFNILPGNNQDRDADMAGFVALIRKDKGIPVSDSEESTNNYSDYVTVGTLEDNTVWYIEKSQGFDEGGRPALASMIQPLLSRYGNEPFSDSDSVKWLYDSQGNFVPFPKSTTTLFPSDRKERSALYNTECKIDYETQVIFQVETTGENYMASISSGCSSAVYTVLTLSEDNTFIEYYILVMFDAKSRRDDIARKKQVKIDQEKNKGVTVDF